MNHRELFSGISFLIVGIAVAWMGKGFYADAAYIPIGTGVLMGLFSLPLILRGAASLLTGQGRGTIAVPLVEAPRRFAATLICCLIYYLAMPVVGFYTTSALFVLLLAVVLGERRPWVLTSIALSFIALLYGLFAVVLKRPLPIEFFLAS